MADFHLDTVSGIFPRLIGVIAVLLGVGTILGSAWWIGFGVRDEKFTITAAALGFLAILGLIIVNAGIRLVSGRRRADGGLLPPAVLYFGAVMFFSFVVIGLVIFDNPDIFGLFGATAAGVSCIVLAKRRQENR